jgi:ABC-type phosphate transport system auxiliary subunit
MSESKNYKPRVLRRTGGKLKSDLKPIVLEYKGRKKKSKPAEDTNQEKYSEGLEDVQTLEGNVLRVVKRAAKVVSKGIDTYDNERQKSAKEKTDGAIEDFFQNAAKATSTSLKEASEIPLDVVESLNTESYRKRLRKNLRRSSKLIRLFRI